MSVDSQLPGTEPKTEMNYKVVTTKVGDEGTTSLGIHGFINKGDMRIELMGGLDTLRAHAHGLEQRPSWLDSMLTDMMVSMTRMHDIKHEERLKSMEDSIALLRDSVSFSDDGWFSPATEQSRRWDVFRALVRKVERDAWRVYTENDSKLRFKDMAQMLNRLSDFAFMMAMLHSKSR
jgi:cob(I)alamin adenosyltransferase